MNPPIVIFILFMSCRCSIAEESTCSAEDKQCSQTDHQKYRQSSNNVEKWNKYLIEYENAAGTAAVENFPYRSTINQDLSVFKKRGISKDMLDRSREADKQSVTYQHIDGKLYRSRNCLFPARCEGVEYFLSRAVKKSNMPDFELVLNVHDWPIVNKYIHRDSPLPTFSFSKTADYFDIFFPAWTFWAGGPAISLHPTGLGRWGEMSKKLLKAGKSNPWSTKKDMAFFRGSRTSGERDALILLSRNAPHLADAKYTKNQSWKSKKDTLGEEPASEVRLEDHCHYKYLFNYRGVAASFRFKHLFLCGSTVLNVVDAGAGGGEWKEFFYDAMTPWYHYIPVRDNSQEGIRDLIEFLNANPEVAATVANRGRDFVENHLRIRDVHKYWRLLLKSYAKLLKFKPVRNSDFVEIL